MEEGLVGMAVGGIRRVQAEAKMLRVKVTCAARFRQVRPDYGLGWKKPGKCAEAIGAGLPTRASSSDLLDSQNTRVAKAHV